MRSAGPGKLAVVDAWHRALRDGALDRVLQATSPDVAIGGPRGTANGHDVLRAWAASARASLEPVRWFCGAGGEVVVAQRATWPGEGGRRTPAIDVATRFTVQEGLIRRIVRHDELDAALAAGGLAAGDEVVARA